MLSTTEHLVVFQCPPPKVLLLVVSKIAFMRPENIAYILVVCNYKCYKRFINHNLYYHA